MAIIEVIAVGIGKQRIRAAGSFFVVLQTIAISVSKCGFGGSLAIDFLSVGKAIAI